MNGHFTAKSNFRWIFSHGNTNPISYSFGTHTDRYPDSNPTKFQTANPIKNTFSVRLKLPHIPKNHLSALTYKHQLRPGRPHTERPPWLLQADCLRFASVTLWPLPVLLKANFIHFDLIRECPQVQWSHLRNVQVLWTKFTSQWPYSVPEWKCAEPWCKLFKALERYITVLNAHGANAPPCVNFQ